MNRRQHTNAQRTTHNANGSVRRLILERVECVLQQEQRVKNKMRCADKKGVYTLFRLVLYSSFS